METVDKLYLELSTITNAFSESDQLGVDHFAEWSNKMLPKKG